jgi:EAL domain-containing protein (putative c-di-GMP-specific phosphodiesterase class I)
MQQIQRYLGFAFASADLLLELSPLGHVQVAIGAAKALTGKVEAELKGRSWRDLVAPADHAMLESTLASLSDGVRRGPLTVELGQSGRMVLFSICRLPGAGAISCALSSGGSTIARPETDIAGYQSREGFESLAEDLLQAAAVIGQELDLALIDTPGLMGVLDAAGVEGAAGIERSFAGALRAEAFGGAPATRLGPERFALIRSKAAPPDLMRQRLSAVVAVAAGDAAIDVQSCILAADASSLSLDRSMRALRYAMDAFVEGGPDGVGAEGLTEAFNQSLQNTLAKAGALGGMVKEQNFELVFQPIVDLKTLEVEHYETLVRFEDGQSPFLMIRMAEELALIEQLDLAIASKAFDRIHARRTKRLRLAVNISGRSIEDAGFVAELRRITARRSDLIDRLVLEVTESAAIKDLKSANRNIQTLRADGHTVCLDDFGAGASSFAYLQALQVDVVKIDGRYVKELGGEGREGVLVRHLVGLCRDLGVTTIGEMIETEAIEEAARLAGVDCGQGWLYGKPAAEPTPPPLRSQISQRRKGVVESWQ